MAELTIVDAASDPIVTSADQIIATLGSLRQSVHDDLEPDVFSAPTDVRRILSTASQSLAVASTTNFRTGNNLPRPDITG
jgi:hypothetical protein